MIASFRRATPRRMAALPVALLLAWWVGRRVGNGAMDPYVAVTAAGLLVLGPALVMIIGRRLGAAFMAVELPLVLLLTSTMVFRARTANELAYNPLDSAATFRVVCVGIAGLLGIVALLSKPRPGAVPERRLTTLPFRLYAAYVAVVVIGAFVSVKPVLTLYRAVELVAGLVVLAGAYRALGAAASARIERTLFRFTVVLLANVWLGAVLFPSQAIVHPLNKAIPIDWQLEGVYPSLAANTVGALGTVIAVWSLARVLADRRSGRSARLDGFTLVFGLVTLGAAQYRTGYVAFTVTALVLLGLRRPRVLMLGLGALALAVYWNPSLVSTAEPYALRGQTPERASELSGRTDYWSDALPVWAESPIVGRGLLTASRFEVLAPAGYDRTAGIHSTWVEALVGTGTVGFALLLAFAAVTIRRAWRAASRGGPLVPLAVVLALTVRSLTGNMLESFNHQWLIYLAAAVSLADPVRTVARGGVRPLRSVERVGVYV